EYRFCGLGGTVEDVALCDDFRCIIHNLDVGLDAECLEPLFECFCLLLRTVVEHDPFDIPHFNDTKHLFEGHVARTDGTDRLRILPCQPCRRDGGHATGAEACQV